MPLNELVITLLAILLGSGGQLMIKVGMNSITSRCGAVTISNIWGNLPEIISTPQILIAILLFFASAMLWMVMMSRRDLSQVYPFIALAHIFVTMMAYVFLKEQIGVLRIAGIAIIVIGVVVLAHDKVVSTIN